MAAVEHKFAEYRMKGSYVALNRACARKLGTVAAAYLCHAIYVQTWVGAGCYWFKKLLADRDPDGRMIPPERVIDQSFEFETGLTRSQQENARKVLEQLGVLKSRRSSFQGRLEYLIDLERLATLEKEWAEEERHITRSTTLEVAFPEGESSALESENPLSSIKSIQSYKERSRTVAATMAPRQNKTNHDAKHGAYSDNKENSRKTVETGGIVCWTNNDREISDSLRQQFGEERIREAVAQVQDADAIPYPSAIKKILFTPTTLSAVEQTSELLKTYYGHGNEKEQQAAARKVVQLLPASGRNEFLEKFIEQIACDRPTSFNFATKKFSNPAEKIQFERWLERQIMASTFATS